MDQSQKSVDDLQQTLQQTAVAEAQKATADDLNQHIERYQEDPAAHHHTLRERLETALVEFGADHPDLTESIRLAIYDLSNAGV